MNSAENVAHLSKLPLTCHLEQIIYAASLAPSPKNSQPWKFLIHADCLEVQVNLDSAHEEAVTKLDFTAVGMAIENLRCAARHFGYEARVHINADPERAHVAFIYFSPSSASDQDYHYIYQRRTDRSLFSNKKVDPLFWREVKEVCEGYAITLSKADTRKGLWTVGWVAAGIDALRVQSQSLHAFLFKHLVFSKKEFLRLRQGLWVGDLKLPFFASLVLRILKSRWVSRLFNWLPAMRFLGWHSFRQIIRSDSVAVFSIDERNLNSIVKSGMAMERIWLIAQRHGVSIHPLGGMSTFMDLAMGGNGNGNGTDPDLASRAGNIVTPLKNVFTGLNGKVPVFAMRVGYGKIPAEKSLRLPSNVLIINRSEKIDGSCFNYDQAFERNIGLVSVADQHILKHSTIAIPGMGGGSVVSI